MLEIRGIWLCHMSRWDRYVLRPRIWMETSRSGTVPHIRPYNPRKSHGQGLWVSHESHRLDDSSSANRRIRSCSMLLIGDGDYRGAKASAHKARVTDCVLLVFDVSRSEEHTSEL